MHTGALALLALLALAGVRPASGFEVLAPGPAPRRAGPIRRHGLCRRRPDGLRPSTLAMQAEQRGGIRVVYGSKGEVAAPPQDKMAGCYILLSNLQSGSNIGRIVRSASIFGVKEVVIVGQRKFRLSADHGARFDVSFRHFWTFEEAHAYLVERGCTVLGVEIEESAEPLMTFDKNSGVVTFPFAGSTAFMFGNEGLGLSQKQRRMCDRFVFIPQNRGGDAGQGSASLNVACAAAIVLHAFSMWAGFEEAQRAGEKFVRDSGAV